MMAKISWTTRTGRTQLIAISTVLQSPGTDSVEASRLSMLTLWSRSDQGKQRSRRNKVVYNKRPRPTSHVTRHVP
jgi:hypothetical protein